MALIPNPFPLYKAALILICLQNLPKQLKLNESMNLLLFVKSMLLSNSGAICKPSFERWALQLYCHVIVVAVIILLLFYWFHVNSAKCNWQKSRVSEIFLSSSCSVQWWNVSFIRSVISLVLFTQSNKLKSFYKS